MKKLVTIAVLVAVCAVLYSFGLLNTVLIVIASLVSAIMGTTAGLSMVLCSGKMRRASAPKVQPMVATLLLTKMMVSIILPLLLQTVHFVSIFLCKE